MFAFFAGLAAGLLHVFSGPDHLAAVAPLAADGDRNVTGERACSGGIGHTAGVVLIALLLLMRQASNCRWISSPPTVNVLSAPGVDC